MRLFHNYDAQFERCFSDIVYEDQLIGIFSNRRKIEGFRPIFLMRENPLVIYIQKFPCYL